MTFPNPRFRQLGYLVWLVMLAMSLLFYRERAFFMDAGFQLFNLINEGSIQVYHNRFVTAVPQIFPWLLVKMGAPLWAVGMGFSASYILIFGLVYHLLVRWLHNDYLGWALIFLFTLMSFDTFYHMQSEFYLGLALLLLSFGIVLRFAEGTDRKLLLPLLLLLPTVAFSHKLSLIFFGFLWLFFYLGKKELRKGWYWAFLGLFLAAAAVKNIWFTNWYEAAKQAEFRGHWEAYFPNFLALPSNKIFWERCWEHYYFLPLLLGLVSVFYVVRRFISAEKNTAEMNLRTTVKLILVWGGVLGFLLLYNISDPTAQFRFYSEVTYLPLILFVAVPFQFDVVPVFQQKKWLLWLFAGAMLLRLGTIAANHETFERNFTWIENKLYEGRQLGTNRFLLKKENAPMDTVLMDWGVPFTAMHLSALHGPEEAATLLILPDFSWYEEKLDRTDVFFSPFNKVLEKNELNPRYYDLPEGKYLLLEN